MTSTPAPLTAPRAALFAALLCAIPAAPAWGASVTDVLDAADGDDKFDAQLTPSFRYSWSTSRINRERCVDAVSFPCDEPTDLTPPFFSKDVKELDHVRQMMQLFIDARLGLFKDLEFHFTLPIVLQDEQSIQLADGVQADDPNGDRYSSLVEDGIFGRSELTGGGKLISDHSGVGDLSFGFAWAPYNDLRDNSAASWKLAFDMLVPTGSQRKTSLSGGVGRKLVELSFSTALSKRLGIIEPYIGVGYHVPIRLGVSYSNTRCDPNGDNFVSEQNDALFADPDVVGDTTRYIACDRNDKPVQSKIDPGQRGSMFVGMEITPIEKATSTGPMRFSIDLRMWGVYNSKGRDHTEISDFLDISVDDARDLADSEYAGDTRSRDDVLRTEPIRSPFVPIGNRGELTTHDQYAIIGGLFGLYFDFPYGKVGLAVDVSHTTEHLLTMESVGEDIGGGAGGVANGVVDPYVVECQDDPLSGCNVDGNVRDSGTLRVNSDPDVRNEQNPDYNKLVDQPGRRLKLQRNVNIGVTFGLGLSF